MTQEVIQYYARRAVEYEHVYELPHWQPGLVHLRHMVTEIFAGRRVLDGERYEIIKNLFDDRELATLLSPWARTLHVEDLGRFWAATYEARGGTA